VNEVFAHSKIPTNPYKGNYNNKTGNTTTQYSCFICGALDHKIFDCSHQWAALEMLKNKANFKPKKENVAINMVLVKTTRSQVSEADAFKEKETKQNKIVTN
jgi:hypothetical protein